MSETPRTHLWHPRHWGSWLGVGLLALLTPAPWQFRRWLAKHIGQQIYQRNQKRRKIVDVNLEHCFPEWSAEKRQAATRQHFNEYAHALLDYGQLFFRSRETLYSRIVIEGREHLDQAIADGHNVILLLGHSVWLEFAPAAIGQHYRAYGSYKPFKNPVFDYLIARSRLKDVEFVVAREEGMRKLIRALEPGRLLFFLPDEDHGEKNSVFAPFFGIPKATLTTPGRIAKLGKASALPIMAFFDETKGIYTVKIGAAIQNFNGDTETSTAQMNQALETLIRSHPTQYMWLLKLFRTRPEGHEPWY